MIYQESTYGKYLQQISTDLQSKYKVNLYWYILFVNW